MDYRTRIFDKILSYVKPRAYQPMDISIKDLHKVMERTMEIPTYWINELDTKYRQNAFLIFKLEEPPIPFDQWTLALYDHNRRADNFLYGMD